MSRAAWWRGIADGSNNGLTSLGMKLLLAPSALLYAMLLRFRALLYQSGFLTIHRLPCPVISIGNITVGGTGKTPATIMIAKLLRKLDYQVAVLSRGYGGSLEGQVAVVSNGDSVLLDPEQAGDEPCLIAKSVPGLIVVIGADRYQAGLLALEQFQPDFILLDDGFQHIRVHRDLNILLLDATRPFGNGWTLPLGLLREPLSALKRADMVLFTRANPGHTVANPGIPFCVSEHHLAGFNYLKSAEEISLEKLQQVRVAAFAGIADPDAFFEALRALGIPLVATLSLADHEPYSAEGMMALEHFAKASAADCLLTTEKDGVKLAGSGENRMQQIITARLELRLKDGGQLLKQNLDKLLSSKNRVGHTAQT